MTDIRTGCVCGIRFADLLGVVVARWHDDDGDDVRVVPLSEDPFWLENATDRDVLLNVGAARFIAHSWLARTMPADLLGAPRGVLPDDVLRVIQTAEMIGIDSEADRAYPQWRGRPLAGDDDPRLGAMRALLWVWDDAEKFARLFGSGAWSVRSRLSMKPTDMQKRLEGVRSTMTSTLEQPAYGAGLLAPDDDPFAVAA